MTITGTAHGLGDVANTDAILSGRSLVLNDPTALAAHCLGALDPGFRSRVRPGDILAAGRNFGTGSFREHTAAALKVLDIRAIVIASILFRNAVNLGLVVLVAPNAVLEAGVAASVDGSTASQAVRTWHAASLGAEVAAIPAAGGLMQKVLADLVRQELSFG